jgi:hypothetical protein
MKNKTLAVWLSFLVGPLGLHRFYLRGFGDMLGWFLPIPTALGLYGVQRVKQFGLDDPWSWVLIPLLGFTIAGCALTAIVYGLMTPEKWRAKFNQQASADSGAGETSWLTIAAVVLSLFVGATALMASIAYGFQGYFEHQIEESRKISQ